MSSSQAPQPSILIERLRNHWLATGVKIRSGASLQQIDSFERQYHVGLPPDLRAYFTAIDGVEQDETDPDMFSFLPLHSVKTIPEELAHFGGGGKP
jgi:cell wall assembly regulator SMI1